MEAYLATKIGTDSAPGPYAGGADPVSPPHLDLEDVARRYSSDTAGSTAVRRRVQSFKVKRKRWTIAIVWRAAAVHDELWQPPGEVFLGYPRCSILDQILLNWA